MKVTGKERDDGGKDYLISHNGKTYMATKSGSLFCCEGVTDTLKVIKKMIEDGMIEVIESMQLGEVSVNDKEAEVDPKPDIGIGLWGCVHPCALLVLTVGDRALDDEMRKQFILTLDNYGWLMECGSPDYRRAMRDYKVQLESVSNSYRKISEE
tara:strand:+ start:3048 stop:3509 length:462 start_codon:yes stop_codon:yes gene_type:complete